MNIFYTNKFPLDWLFLSVLSRSRSVTAASSRSHQTAAGHIKVDETESGWIKTDSDQKWERNGPDWFTLYQGRPGILFQFLIQVPETALVLYVLELHSCILESLTQLILSIIVSHLRSGTKKTKKKKLATF